MSFQRVEIADNSESRAEPEPSKGIKTDTQETPADGIRGFQRATAERSAESAEAPAPAVPEWLRGAELPPEKLQKLAEKFKSPQAMAKSLAELESARGSQEKPKEISSPAKEPAGEQPWVAKYTDEFAQTGRLSDESISEIVENYGIPKNIVETHLAGAVALAHQQLQPLYSEMGGQETYQQAMQWAQQNLPQERRESLAGGIQRALESGDIGTATELVRSLKTEMRRHRAPELVVGNPRGSEAGPKPFSSKYEMLQAMGSPAYRKGDRVVQKEVMARLAVTDQSKWFA